MKQKFILGIALFMNTICYSQTKYPNVVIETNKGKLEIQLYDNTPLHAENFLKLVNSGFYNNLLFHRVINNFMVQAGDPGSFNAEAGARLGQGGPGYTIPAEIVPEYYHKKGSLAAARLGDQMNPTRASSGSQFYIVQGTLLTMAQLDQLVTDGNHSPFTPEQKISYSTQGGTPHLDNQYTVFGQLISGFDILEAIAAVTVDGSSRPLQDIKILKTYIIKK